MGLKGNIIINAYKLPVQSVRQAERIKEELSKLQVETEIISDKYLRAVADSEGLNTLIPKADFFIYLDKDKYLSSLLEKTGARLFNSHSSIRLCDDKGETVISLAGKGYKLPKTVMGQLCYLKTASVSEEFLDSLIGALKLPIVVKESFGSMGKGVYLAKNKEELRSVCEELKTTPHIFQEYIGYKKGTDVRVIVVGGKAVASMLRCNENDFRSNIALGGIGKNFELNESFKKTAEGVAKDLGLDYCGIDLLFGEDGQPCVCEVNSNAFFEEIEKITGVNVAKIYAEYIVNSL